MRQYEDDCTTSAWNGKLVVVVARHHLSWMMMMMREKERASGSTKSDKRTMATVFQGACQMANQSPTCPAHWEAVIVVVVVAAASCTTVMA